LQQRGEILGFSGLWFTTGSFEAAKVRFLDALSAIHQANPALASTPRERVVERAKLPWSGKPLDRIVAHLVESGAIRSAGTQVRAAGFKVQLTERQRALLDRVVEALDAGDVNAPGSADIASTLRVPPQAVEEVLRLGIQAGEVVRIGEGIHFTVAKLEQLKAETHAAFGSKPFAASEFRDALGTSRKYAIPILEYFDQVRFTLRTGDQRVIRSSD
jgi:selenocysteine-specific elongation factor